MESAEDDAGSTTGASCLSARESVVAEEGAPPTALGAPGPAEAVAAAHDVNTDTILEMIDRLVDGSDGEERQSRDPESALSESVIEPSATVERVVTNDNIPSEENADEPRPSASTSEVDMWLKVPDIDDRPATIEEPKTNCLQTASPVESVLCDTKGDYNVSSEEIASSSEAETSQVSHSSECEPSERTVKCVSSSDSVDRLSVECAEASCSEASDLRPDTTVSSTMDSMCRLWTLGRATDSITKHVSSSSDFREDCDLNEADNSKRSTTLSVCKAETSVSPKRIKLIRKWNSPALTPKESSSNEHSDAGTTLSSDSQKRLSPIPSTSVNCISTSDTMSAKVTEECVNRLSEEQNVESDHCNVVNKTKSKNEKSETSTDETMKNISIENDIDHKKVEPLKLNLSSFSPSKSSSLSPKILKKDETPSVDLTRESKKDESPMKQVPKLTIKLSNRSDECKSPVPKLTIKPIMKPPSTSDTNVNDIDNLQIPSITKLNIKPIPKPAEKIGEIHRKSSSSEISESEFSENDESPSTSDNTASDQSSTDTVPKVTIKMGKPGTDTEGQFYTEKTVPKLTIKTLLNEDSKVDDTISKVKLKICHNEEKQQDKIQKLTIKTVMKPEVDGYINSYVEEACTQIQSEDSIKQIRCEQKSINQPIPKLKITPELTPNENVQHVPKLTIVLKPEEPSKNIKKGLKTESTDSLPIVTKLNIKPIPIPDDFLQDGEESTSVKDKNTNISPLKTLSKNKDSQIDSYKNDIPIITKLHIKPIKNTEDESHIVKHGDWNTDQVNKGIPIVTKLNIKPVVEPVENDSKSETENSSDENSDVPVVTKINIKPIIKPSEMDNTATVKVHSPNTITKLNIKPIIKSDNETDDTTKIKVNSPSTITKLNIKPIVKPDSEIEDTTKNKVNSPNTVTKLNIKPILKPDSEIENTSAIKPYSLNTITKLNIKPIVKPESDVQGSGTTKVNTQNITKLNIKPILKPDSEIGVATPVKPNSNTITKLNIKPIVRADNELDDTETARGYSPNIITKINIKPIIKPDNEVDRGESSPKKLNSPNTISVLNIKPIVKPDSEVEEVETGSVSSPNLITKLNIKPIVKPEIEYKDIAPIKDTSQTTITKLNIKPIVNVDSEINDTDTVKRDSPSTITKLYIKPIVKHDSEIVEESSFSLIDKVQLSNAISDVQFKDKPENEADNHQISDSSHSGKVMKVPNVTKLNIKPVPNPDTNTVASDSILNNCDEEISSKNPPIVMKINLKNMADEANSETVAKCKEKSEPTATDISKSNENAMNEHSLKKETYNPEDVDNTIVEEKLETNINKVFLHDVSTDKSDKKAVEVINISLDTEKCSMNTNHDNKMISDSNKIDSGETTDTKELATQEHSNKHIDNSDRIDITESTAEENLSNLAEKCTLLKRLLIENKSNDLMKKDNSKKVCDNFISTASTIINYTSNETQNVIDELDDTQKTNSEFLSHELIENVINKSSLIKQCINSSLSSEAAPDNCNKTDIEIKNKVESSVIDSNLFKPLEIITSEKSLAAESSGQDSPRIILKINKTDHGTSSKIITDEIINLDSPKSFLNHDNIQNIDEKPKVTRIKPNRRKQTFEMVSNTTLGKRLRSSKVLEDVTPSPKKDINKNPDTSKKDTEVTLLDTKRLKLDDLLTNSLTVSKIPNKSPNKHTEVKNTNHSILNNDNGSKNGSSKLLDILSNLKVLKTPFEDESAVITKNSNITYAESLTSSNSSDVIEVIQPVESISPVMTNENSNAPIDITCDETIQDPLDIEISKSSEDLKTDVPLVEIIPEPIVPTPRKRGRPRKLPVTEDIKPVLPVPAIEERPQRSLRLYRERPAILSKPRGRRGRGRGRRTSSGDRHTETEDSNESPTKPYDKDEDIDPTSSRIKLPRLTEALDNMPLSYGRRRVSSTDSREVRRLLSDNAELKVVLEELRVKSPETVDTPRGRGRGGLRGRGSRGGAILRTPRGQRGRRGGGRGAMYMKETMGIYGRVCGPATTTVQLFEEETCMMDDNATPSKPSHLLDEDSQSSVKSSTNESKYKKSKFADVFDSNKVWTAADVKEYIWPAVGSQDGAPRVMMIQEQLAMFLEVKSFKRKYPELKRRTICAEERDFVLAKGLVTEALCDLGITAVDAGDVLDIMLSDFPHKYEEFRTHQRNRQLTDPEAVPAPLPLPLSEDVKPDTGKVEKEGKSDSKSGDKTAEPMSEKMRQDLAAAAIASASEFNARLNALRRPACVDLQSYVVQTRRRPVVPAPRPPPNLYPHALLPGQYQHWYRVPTDACYSYFPLNTVMGAAPAPAPPDTHTDSEPDWGYLSSDYDSDGDRTVGGKRKKLTKSKKTQAETIKVQPLSPPAPEETCRTCGLEDRKLTSERFLTCAKCNAKLHPSCLEFGIETTRKCRTYPWHCPTCKSCATCGRLADDQHMMFCDLCDRGLHYYCAGLDAVPQGRWHCVDCAVCKSCGARAPEGPTGVAGGGSTPGGSGGAPEWHHQSRRGPGGQKQYSHTLCAPCARAFRIGRYCPVCERSFIGPKGTMQLVICKLCDRQHHQECVSRGNSTPNVMEYTCSECRRTGITSRSAAARLAPRTIATLFMAKRRFNKYVHRQYVASRLQEQQARRDQDDSSNCT